MDQFVDRAELLRRLDREYQRFHTTIAPLTPEQLQTPGVVGVWAIKDVIAHFIAHEQFALRELQHALRGERYILDERATATMNERAVAERQHQSVTEVLHQDSGKEQKNDCASLERMDKSRERRRL